MKLAGTTAVFLSVAVAVVPPASAGDANKPVTVTGHEKASLHDIVYLQAGSGTHLVYIDQRAVAGHNREFEPTPARILARSRSGRTVQVGVLPYPTHTGAMSTVGERVVALRTNSSRRVDVWNIGNRAHRVIRLPRTASNIAATPHGFAYAHRNSLYEWVARTATHRSWGAPFGSKTITSLVADGRHVVVTVRSGRTKAMSYRHAGRYRKLRAGGVAELRCRQVNHHGALCADVSDANVVFVPLDGSPATKVDGPHYVTGYALAGTTVLWLDDTDHFEERLRGFKAGLPVVVTSQQKVARLPGIVGAFGKAIVTSSPGSADDIDTVLGATSPNDISTEFTIPRSLETAGALALTAGQLTYVSDARNPDDPDQVYGVRSVSVQDQGDHVVVGSPQDLAGRDGDRQVVANGGGTDPIASSDRATVFLRETSGDISAYVRTGTGTTALPGRIDLNGGLLGAAGHRVLEGTSPALSDEYGLYLYDLDTGQTQRVLEGTDARSAALTETALFYGTDAGEVRRYDLATGGTTTVFTPATAGEYAVEVYAKGGWVAWTEAPPGHSRQAVGRLKDVEHDGPVVTLAHPVFGISGAGVLLFEPSSAGYRCCFRVPPPHVSTWFQQFGGDPRTLLSSRRFVELPQLTGHVLAWIDQFGDLKVKRYDF
jgi:hypothetical protein